MNPSLLTQSSLFGIGIAFSPLHIGVVTLLLLGRAPLRRSFAYVLGWSLANLLAVGLLMLLGSSFPISLAHGERDQVLIDLLGAGGLLALGLYQLTPQAAIGEELSFFDEPSSSTFWRTMPRVIVTDSISSFG